MKTRIKVIIVALLFLVSGAVAVAGPAQPVSAAGECGSSYTLVGSYPVINFESGKRGGTLEIYWSNYTGKNCAINRAYNNYGIQLDREVCIRVHRSDPNGGYSCDQGQYYYYAGPVKTGDARGKCIDANAYTVWGGRPYAVQITNKHCG